MLRIWNRLILTALFMTGLLFAGFIQPHVYGEPFVMQDTMEILRSLSPEQRNELEKEMKKSGGSITPELIKGIKAEPLDSSTSDEQKESKPEEEELTVKEGGEKDPSDGKETESVSLFSRYRTVGPYQTISTELLPFGYDFFQGLDDKELVPRKDTPVSSDYVVGPGDEVKIMLWGRVNTQENLVVDRDGNISVPQIGPLQVSGMRFDEMKTFLSDQADKIVGASLNVTMGALKSIQVFVLGEVKKPGSYSLDSFSTITSALLASGGPTDIGSLRNVQLKRKNSTIVTMDFYEFLLKGDKSQDSILRSGDVVFVPTAGGLVGIAGNVRRPAVYELKSENSLQALFDMAGGVLPVAYTQQIQVERIEKNERHIVIDIDDKSLNLSDEFELLDGDLVKVFPIVDKDVNTIYLAGNVKRPGKYEYKQGMKVKDLLSDTSDLLKDTYFDYALIKRFVLPGMKTELIPLNLGRLLLENDSESNILLEPQDSIYVFSVWSFRDRPGITVQGRVRKPGDYELLANYKVRDAIMEAGGLSRDASYSRGEVFRVSESGEISQVFFNVGMAMAEDVKDNVPLQDGDRIVVHSIWEERYKREVYISGDVKNPGKYPLTKNMRVSDLIFASGNLLESAYIDEAEISSFIVEEGRKVKLDYKSVSVALALDNDPEHNVLLAPDDRLFIKKIPHWKEKSFVDVSGEIMFPGEYIIKKGETLSSVLERAGGYSDNAYLRGAVFTREGVRQLQQKSLEEMIIRLEREILAEGSAQVSAALTSQEIEAKKVELQHKQKFIESLEELKATGRMTIRLAHMRLLKNSKYDIKLEDGDTITIPTKSNVINVVGAVMSQGSFIYSDKLDYKDYIEMAGGITRFADNENVYILKVDGTAKKMASGLFNWNSSRERWQVTALTEIKDMEPGDTIVVPEKLDRVAWLREIKDISQILYQIAVTAGVAIVVF